MKLALTPPSAAGARPAALSSLRSLLRGLRPLFNRLQRPMQEKNSDKKKSESENFSSIEIQKKKNPENFFFDFPKFFFRRNLSYDE